MKTFKEFVEYSVTFDMQRHSNGLSSLTKTKHEEFVQAKVNSLTTLELISLFDEYLPTVIAEASEGILLSK